jgi:hypothetical protein
MDNVCLVIPTYRERIQVLEHVRIPEEISKVFVISDPRTFVGHHQAFEDHEKICVTLGVEGMSPQVLECYKVARAHGFDWFFRLDDDMKPRCFLHKDGHIPDLREVILECLKCAEETKTGMVGLNNSMNRHWMGEGYGRATGLIYGGAHLCKSSSTPEQFLDPRILYYEDVYRSMAHREEDGAVGRVKHIGVDKSGSSARVEEAAEKHRADIDLILERFPGMIECRGMKAINNGQYLIADWRCKKGTTPRRERT